MSTQATSSTDNRDRTLQSYADVDAFVAATRTAVFVREVDGLLLLRPEKTLGVNESASSILRTLYAPDSKGSERAVAKLAKQWRISREQLWQDVRALLQSVRALLCDDFRESSNVHYVGFDRAKIKFPVMAEIALTYRCQNRCSFCYAASPVRAHEGPEMTTQQVIRVMDRIWDEAHVPSLSFTGGEATLRSDLEPLIVHGAKRGFRLNIITNGVRLADDQYVVRLRDAGLAAAQVSIEAGEPTLHDTLVGRQGAFTATTKAIENLRKAGLHVHTNTTLSRANLGRGPDVIRFVARSLGLKTLSMNFLIRTGLALDDETPVTYAEIAECLPVLCEVAKAEGVKFVWYSPLPYCVTNPVLLGQGAKSCACVTGLLSVSPTGELLPCSSFQQGLGSLLDHTYSELMQTQAARYWQSRAYAPPGCRNCEDLDVCGGACPLYWDAVGSFRELPCSKGTCDEEFALWRDTRRLGGSFGVARRRHLSVWSS
jgi:radical SAM protein with 4Fe4S-binding SPASM domain